MYLRSSGYNFALWNAYLSAGNDDRVLHELKGYWASELIRDDRRCMLYGGRPGAGRLCGGSFSDDAVFKLLEQGGHLLDAAIRFTATGDDHLMQGKGFFLDIGHGVQLQLI